MNIKINISIYIMKKKVLFLLTVFLYSITAFAQEKKEVIIKAGTIVPLESISNVRASKAHEGQNIDFKVSRDVIIDKVVAIPAGTIAKGVVYEAKRSAWLGTKGRLGIRMRYLTLPSGDNVNFSSSEVYITGKNRTPLSVVIFCCTCIPLPCGSKAEMKIGYEFDASVANNTVVIVE